MRSEKMTPYELLNYQPKIIWLERGWDDESSGMNVVSNGGCMRTHSKKENMKKTNK